MRIPVKISGPGREAKSAVSKLTRAFTLVEVMIAMAILFMGVFAILDLVSTNLRAARTIQKSAVDPTMVIAELYQTNKLTEGLQSGDFAEIYPGYTWTRSVDQVASNGLFKIKIVVSGPKGKGFMDDNLTLLLWRPDSQAGANFGTH